MPIYIKYGDIKGDVTAEGHKDWIEVNSFQWGVGRGISSPTGGGADRESSDGFELGNARGKHEGEGSFAREFRSRHGLARVCLRRLRNRRFPRILLLAAVWYFFLGCLGSFFSLPFGTLLFLEYFPFLILMLVLGFPKIPVLRDHKTKSLFPLHVKSKKNRT